MNDDASAPGQQPAPHYAQPQFQPQQSQPQPQPQPYVRAPEPRGGVNVLGVIALALHVLLACSSFFAPLLWRYAIENGDHHLAATVQQFFNLGLVVLSAGLAIGGLLQRSATRLRWTAIGALVASALTAVSLLGGFLGGLLSSVLAF